MKTSFLLYRKDHKPLASRDRGHFCNSLSELKLSVLLPALLCSVAYLYRHSRRLSLIDETFAKRSPNPALWRGVLIAIHELRAYLDAEQLYGSVRRLIGQLQTQMLTRRYALRVADPKFQKPPVGNFPKATRFKKIRKKGKVCEVALAAPAQVAYVEHLLRSRCEKLVPSIHKMDNRRLAALKWKRLASLDFERGLLPAQVPHRIYQHSLEFLEWEWCMFELITAREQTLGLSAEDWIGEKRREKTSRPRGAKRSEDKAL